MYFSRNRVTANNGVLTIGFNLPRTKRTSMATDVTQDIVFRYSFKLKHNILNQYVLYQKTSKYVEFRLRFANKGVHEFKIYGKSKHFEFYDLVCDYVIDCQHPSEVLDHYPACPAIGWGPNCLEAVAMKVYPGRFFDSSFLKKLCNLYMQFFVHI